MSSDFTIRFVSSADAQQILNIYEPFVLNTATSFETNVPPLSEFQERIKSYSSLAPWLVAELDGQIVGYAYATAHRSRGAYQWSQETTVYIHPDFRKRGIAQTLYEQLLSALKSQGFCKALAIITLPNEPSVNFHQKLGFKHIGEMKNIGFKFDRWHTTSWWDLDLQQLGHVPSAIKPMESIKHLFG